MNTIEFVKEISENGSFSLIMSIGGYSTDLTVEALEHNETRINEIYPFGHKALVTSYIPFAVHLGMCIIEHIPGAKWVEEELDNPFNLAIEIPVKGKSNSEENKIKLFPMNRVDKFWQTGREFNFSCMLRTAIFMSQNDMTDPKLQDEADEDGWFKIGGGDLIRIVKFEKKQEDIN